MEAKRLEANELFKKGDLAAASIKYLEALSVYPAAKASLGPQPALEEYTKSAGNLCTCFHKRKEYKKCMIAARNALAVNPFLAKCHAFGGMCLLDEAKESSSDAAQVSASRGKASTAWLEDAHLHFCRAIYVLAPMKEQLKVYLSEAVERLTEAYAEIDGEAVLEDCAKVSSSSGCGNGVFATTLIARGVNISSTLHPFSVAPYGETDGCGVCIRCAVPNTNGEGTRCEGCKAVWYCSPACADAHAAQHDMWECRYFLKLKEMVRIVEERQIDAPDDFQDLAAHVITTRSSYESKQLGYERLFDLESHAIEVSQSLHPISALMHDLFPEDAVEQLTTLIGIVRCNSLEIRDATGLGVGQGLHLAGLTSFFNHSCAPNCAIDHRTQTIRSIRTISPEEQLSISYIPQLYWPSKYRKEGLAERYFFTCRCSRCQCSGGSEEDAIEKVLTTVLPTAKPDASNFYHLIVQNVCSGIRCRPVSDISAETIKEIKETEDDAKRHLHPTHYLFQDLRNTLTFAYSVLGMSNEAFESSLEELLLWEALIPGALPVKADKVRNAMLCLPEVSGEMKNSTAGRLHFVDMLEAYSKMYKAL